MRSHAINQTQVEGTAPPYERSGGTVAVGDKIATATRIGESVLIRGEVTSVEDLQIDGQVEGTIELRGHNLSIGNNGRVDANIFAKAVTVFGTLKGNIRAVDRMEIRKTGSFIGQVKAGQVSIESGAYFKGSIDICRFEEIPEGQAISEFLSVDFGTTCTSIETAGPAVIPELQAKVELRAFSGQKNDDLISRFHELVDRKLEETLSPEEALELQGIEEHIDAEEERQMSGIHRSLQDVHYKTLDELRDLISELRALPQKSS